MYICIYIYIYTYVYLRVHTHTRTHTHTHTRTHAFIFVWTELNLNFNNLGVEGATALVPALSRMHTLTHLKLFGNLFGHEGAQVFKCHVSLQGERNRNECHAR